MIVVFADHGRKQGQQRRQGDAYGRHNAARTASVRLSYFGQQEHRCLHYGARHGCREPIKGENGDQA